MYIYIYAQELTPIFTQHFKLFHCLRGVPHLTVNTIFAGLVPAVIAWPVEETLCAVCSRLEKKKREGCQQTSLYQHSHLRKRFETLFRYISQIQCHRFSWKFFGWVSSIVAFLASLGWEMVLSMNGPLCVSVCVIMVILRLAAVNTC